MGPRVVEQSSDVAAPIDAVWTRVVSPEGINDEMRPWMTMTMPKSAAALTVDTVPLGVPLGRAWLRLFGVLPFDHDSLCIESVEPGRAFHERSTMLSMSTWWHDRTLTPVSDTETSTPSLPGARTPRLAVQLARFLTSCSFTT